MSRAAQVMRAIAARFLVASAFAIFVASGVSAAAQGVEAFYKGRTLNLIVGYGPGGGYDAYARLVARHMGRYIPGQPNIVVQNMPGAGSLVATNYLYRIAPKDGTVFGSFARNMPLMGLFGRRQIVQFDPVRFTWLGSAASFKDDAYLLVARKTNAMTSVADLRLKGGAPLVLGSTAEGASSDLMPIVLRELLGLNVKAISGYTDSSQLFLAIDRGEIEGRMVGLSAIRSNRPEWLRPDGPMRILVAMGSKHRHPDFPEVPMAWELATGERERKLVEAIELPYLLSRPYAAPPGVPADRARALKHAFLAVHKDPQLLAEAQKIGIDISPVGAAEVLAVIRRVAETPPDLFKMIERLIASH